MTQEQKPYNITITPNLAGITFAGRNGSAQRFTITNNDSRDCPEVRINVLRADLMPNGTMSEVAIVKAGAGETVITDRWVEVKMSTDVAYSAINDWDIPLAFDLDAGETKAFDVRLVIPDDIDVQAKISFSLMISFKAVPEAKVTAISIDGTPLVDVHVGRTPATVLTATVTAEAGADTTYTWSSADENIFTIASDGTITGVSAGRSIVTAISSNPQIYNGVYLTLLPPEVISITIDNKPLGSIQVGNPLVLTATVVADTGADLTVTWSSSDEAIATIASDGTVTAIIAGIVTFTATSSDPLIFDTAGLTIDMPVLTGIVGWFDAADATTITTTDGTQVSEWADKSGLGNHADGQTSLPTTGTTTLNGKNVIKFTGQQMRISPVTSITPYADTNYTICAVWQPAADSEMLAFFGYYEADNAILIQAGSNSIKHTWYDAGLDTAVASYDANLIIATYDGTARTTRIDGVDDSDTPGIKSTVYAFASLGGCINLANKLNGYIAEFIIYHRALTPTEILQNENYLNKKWGV